jgi:hypothetical protein
VPVARQFIESNCPPESHLEEITCIKLSMEKYAVPDSPKRSSEQDTSAIPSSTELNLSQDADGEVLHSVISGPPHSIFSRRTKLFIVLAVSVSALISPFAATLFYPALNVLAEQLNVSASLVNLSITTYMVFLC